MNQEDAQHTRLHEESLACIEPQISSCRLVSFVALW